MMMSTGTVSLEQRGHVAIMRFAKPPNNHIDSDVAGQIADHWQALDNDPACRAIVLASDGRIFCAGADFGEGALATGPFYEQVMRLYRTRKPVVAAVQGAAIGAGLGLAVACDFRVSCVEARFSANFTRLGIHPGFGLSVTLPRLIGMQKAALMFHTARRIGGTEALALGLVDSLVPQDDVLGAAIAMAEEIALSSPNAVQSIRATMREGLADRIEAANRHERAIQDVQMASDDFREGVAAMSERRLPVFTGGG
jgi:enoyl-CoA hydratase/carnithine racemase